MPAPKWKTKKMAQLQKHFREILTLLGCDMKDANFINTPKRVASLWYDELYRTTPSKKLLSSFPSDHNQMVMMTGYRHWTRCPHHLEKVKLITNIAYIPKGRVIGSSKLNRIADYFAHGLVLQEDYTQKLADCLSDILNPQGVGVLIVGEHLCIQSRGVKSLETRNITSTLRGVFLEEGPTREEFLILADKGDRR